MTTPPSDWLVQEVIDLAMDGTASCTRTLTIHKASTICPEILEELLPDDFTDVSVTERGSSPVAADINDMLPGRTVSWRRSGAGLCSDDIYEAAVCYNRTYVAQAHRGYLNLAITYRARNLVAYDLRIAVPAPLTGYSVDVLAPHLDDDSQGVIQDGDSICLLPRLVSMNRPFRLSLTLEIIGTVDIPVLPVLDFVTNQLRSGRWFPTSLE
jgi:hypothetical protein